MTVYNKKVSKRSQAKSPIRARDGGGVTHEGHRGYGREPKSELFLLATTQFMSQDAFYEKAKERDNRFVNLVRQVAVEDPVWMLQFVRWLRGEANIRTAAVVAGLEAAKARLDANLPSVPGYEVPGVSTDQGVDRLLAKVGISRADEVGEALAYWIGKYGRPIPKPIKRALADKATKLYNEFSLLKYDTGSHGFRFGDVIELVRPKPGPWPWQSDLFRYAIERRHGRGEVPESLRMVSANVAMRFLASAPTQDFLYLLDSDRLREAGMTWEDVLSLAGSKLDKKLLWESMIPSMGYMALLRNLRNFDQAGVSHSRAEYVAQYLSDPDRVKWSRQLPMRFLTAYHNAPSLRWSWPLEQALQLSLSNIPELLGHTLILVDTSGSMGNRFSDKSTLQRWDVAALFGIALAQRCETANVVSFSNTSREFRLPRGESLLASLKTWEASGLNLNSGTNTVRALQVHVKNSTNRVVIITDEQAAGYSRYYDRDMDMAQYMAEVNSVVPAPVPLHVINVAGYSKGMIPSGGQNRHVYGGLTDQVFKLIPIVEAGENGSWPWEQQ